MLFVAICELRHSFTLMYNISIAHPRSPYYFSSIVITIFCLPRKNICSWSQILSNKSPHTPSKKCNPQSRATCGFFFASMMHFFIGCDFFSEATARWTGPDSPDRPRFGDGVERVCPAGTDCRRCVFLLCSICGESTDTTVL